MEKYTVYFKGTCELGVTLEAESPEEADEEAGELLRRVELAWQPLTDNHGFRLSIPDDPACWEYVEVRKVEDL